MNVSHVPVAKNFAAESVFGLLDTQELFTCVSRLWRSVVLPRLRRKLISVSVCRAQEPEDLHAMPPAPIVPSCVDSLCPKFARFRNIPRMAGMHPSLVFISCHADLNEDKRVVGCPRELLPPDCVVVCCDLMVVHAPKRDTEEGSHEGIFGEFLFRIDTLGCRPTAWSCAAI
ncbi:uncharacterized protein LOC144119971 [Amblyomma americanum]